MSACTLLQIALQKKSAAGCAACPETNAPGAPKEPGQPETFAAGEFHPKVRVAEGSRGDKAKKTAGVMEWLLKTAGIAKVAARRPGRLDGDESLDKLAKLHSKRKK
ncbi:MAG TPA: hypothetical protein PLS53_00330 [Thermoanaerobaculaceae bacterium]|nr:hypothetical protein [Thermoanaerobaculaceae bacterium]HPS76580.1 hypothetical protein [Thermoanaerobaculaceae bacterium]